MSGWYRLPTGGQIGAFGKSGSTSLSQVSELRQISGIFEDWDCISSSDTTWLVVRDPKSRMISATYQKLINNISVYSPDTGFMNQHQYFAAFEDRSYWLNLIDNYFTDAGLIGPESEQHWSTANQRGEKDPWHIPPWDHYHTANYLIHIPEEIKISIVNLENLNDFLKDNNCTPVHAHKNEFRGPIGHERLGIRVNRLKHIYEIFKECIVESRAWPKLLKYLEPEQKRYDRLIFLACNIYGTPEKVLLRDVGRWKRSLFP